MNERYSKRLERGQFGTIFAFPEHISFQDPTCAMSELHKFVEGFIVAVDFQKPLPIEEGTKLEDLPEWDSLAALGVIVMCDTDYGVSITGDDLKACVTVGDIYSRVEQKKAA
jgi:acyl carrier protein